MTVAPFLAGGFVGALVMAVALEGAAQAHLTRLDLPLFLGTAFHRGRAQARAAGYTLHVGLGIGFAAAYDVLGADSWGVGALVGIGHGAIAVTVLLPVLVPVLHPRMAIAGGGERALMEAPGLLLRGYGWWTAPVLVALHAAYGCLVGGFASLAA